MCIIINKKIAVTKYVRKFVLKETFVEASNVVVKPSKVIY